MAVTFGCRLTAQAPLASPEALRTLARRAEDLGFDSVWVTDHIIIPGQVESSLPSPAGGASPFNPDQPFYEPLSVLNFLAGCTQRIRLGSGVLIVPYRHPVLTAKILATLDVLSGGRLIVGVGWREVGWREEEFKALGLNTYAERGTVTNEFIRLFKELWTKEDPEFQGKYYQLAGVGFQPKPVQKPHPPIWIAGDSEPALRRAAELGDGWMPNGLRPASLLEPTEIAGKIASLRALMLLAGRPEETVIISFTAPIAFPRRSTPSRGTLSGHPEEIAVDLRRYEDLGVRNFIIFFPADSISERLEAMEQFSREVIPLVRQE